MTITIRGTDFPILHSLFQPHKWVINKNAIVLKSILPCIKALSHDSDVCECSIVMAAVIMSFQNDLHIYNNDSKYMKNCIAQCGWALNRNKIEN